MKVARNLGVQALSSQSIQLQFSHVVRGHYAYYQNTKLFPCCKANSDNYPFGTAVHIFDIEKTLRDACFFPKYLIGFLQHDYLK